MWMRTDSFVFHEWAPVCAGVRLRCISAFSRGGVYHRFAPLFPLCYIVKAAHRLVFVCLFSC